MFECADPLSTAQMLFEITLMKFNANEIIGANPILGPLVFTIFVIIVVFIVFNMFLSILNNSFRLARANQGDDQQMISYMIDKFLRWIGLKRATAREIQEERDVRMRSQYFDPIVNFPDKMDQFLAGLDKIYTNQRIEMKRLDKAGV